MPLFTIVANTDECRRRLVASLFITDVGDATLYVGDTSGTDYDWSTGLRFLSIPIPKGAVISHAHLSLYAQGVAGVPPTITLQGEAADNPDTFSNAGDYDGRVRTTASVAWLPAAWVGGNWYDTPEIKTIIQEIVNRAAWASGNAMVLFGSEPGGWGAVQNRLAAESYRSGEAPRLTLVWFVPKRMGNMGHKLVQAGAL